MPQDIPDIIDITPPLTPSTPVYPGDAPYSLELTADAAAGDPATVSAVRMSPHCGAHADAPSHIFPGAADIAQLGLEPFIGPCTIVDLAGDYPALPGGSDGAESLIGMSAIEGMALAPRVLFRTREVLPKAWTPRFRALAPELARHLADRGTLLVGIDTPSVDPAESTRLETHRILLSAGIAVLENLDLRRAAAGTWELTALPLPLAGAEASPVRAVLRPLGQSGSRR